jgi:tetratricopeptide (TPR) repeat protein
LYETRRAEFLRHRGNYGLSHPESVVVTWLLNFEQIGADAQELLRLFAYLAPDDIPEELVAVDTGTPGTILAAVASDKERLRKAVKNLRRYSLISRHTGERTYTIHRLVQAVTQDEMDEKMQLLWGKQAIYMVHRLYVDTDLQWKDTSEWWRRYERFLPHAQMCLARAMKDEKGRLSIVAMELLSSSIAYYLYQCGRYEEAYTFYRYAEVYQRAVLGVEHLQTIRAQNNLGVLCTMQGRYGDQKWRDAARHELTDASAASFGRHEFEYSVITNNLGVLRHFEEAYRDAETCYKIALAKMKELNVEHHWLSSVQVNLAQLYREQGRHEEARALSQQTGRPDVLDDTIEETVQIAKSYLTGGPDFLGMEQSTQFPSLPPLKDFLDEKWAQAVSDTGISPTEISSMMDTFAQTYKVYSAEGSENALAFFRDAVKPLNWWREEDDILIKELLPLQMQILETVFRFEGPQFDDTRETDISSDEVGESFLNVFQQLRSIPSKAKALFPIWLSDLDLTDITDKPNQEGLGEEFSQKIIDSVLNSTSISEPASETEEQIQEPRAVVKNNIHESTGSSLSLGVTTQWDKIKATHPELDLSTLEKQIDYFCKQNAKVLVNAYNRCDEAGKAKRKAAFSLLGLSELTNEEALKDQLLAFWWEYSGKRKRFEYENVARAIVEGSRRNGAIDYELLEEHLRELSQLLNAFGSGGHVIIRDHIKAYASRLSHGDDYIFHQNAC